MNYSHFISFVKSGDVLQDGVYEYEVVKEEFYVCGSSRIVLQNLTTKEEFELGEWDSRCQDFIQGPIPGEFDS